MVLPLVLLAHANVYQYHDSVLRPNVIQYRRVGMYTAEDAPSAGAPGDGSSSITLKMDFRRTRFQQPGVIQLLVFHASQLPLVGTGSGAARAFCCTPELQMQSVPGCDRVGHIIVNAPTTRHGGGSDDARRLRARDERDGRDAKGGGGGGGGGAAGGAKVWMREVSFGENQGEATVDTKVAVHESGVHYLLLSSCDVQTGEVLTTGETSWLNPYGYLPGELYPFLPFFGAMSGAYALLAIVWAVMCARHWAQLLPLQLCIGGVLVLGVCETATWYHDYHNFNAGGTRGLAPVVIGVLVSTVKKTLSRLLVLVVCLGYGVARPTLGATAWRVAALGALYFACSAVLDVASNVAQLSEVSVPLRLLFILPVALLDALFYWWVFAALTRTLAQLSTRRQGAKLLLYRRFSHVLVVSIVLSAVWVSCQMGVIVSDALDARWAWLWIFDGFWHLLYFLILLAICYLWSPSKNNLQYAYMDELSSVEQDDEEEG